MNRHLLLAGTVLVLKLGSAHAADAPACPPQAAPLSAEAAAAAKRDARDHGFLWRITKDGRSSFLYGTIHAARQDWMFPGPTIVEAMQASDTVALELDALAPDIQSKLAASIVAMRHEPLPASLARRLEQRRVAECIDAAGWARFPPELQIASLMLVAGRRDGLDPAHAIDVVLASTARELGKPVVSLEAPESQTEALQMPTRAGTVALVQGGLDDLDANRARPLVRRIAKAWVDSDYAELSRYTKWCGCLRTAAERAAMKRLLDDRNPALAEGIDKIHVGGRSVFAAVGSLHLFGPKGLPALLKRRGYKIEQGAFSR